MDLVFNLGVVSEKLGKFDDALAYFRKYAEMEGVTAVEKSRAEGFIRRLVQSGRYASASEVMRDSLRLLEEREQIRAAKLAALRADIREGLDSGPSEPLDMEAIKAEARRRRSRQAGGHGA